MRDRVRDEEARVIVHERRHVDALMATKQEGEDVALPELVRLCPLESPRRLRTPIRSRCGRHHEALLSRDLSDSLLGDAERLDPLEHVTHPARSVLRMLLPGGHDWFSDRLRGNAPLRPSLLVPEPILAVQVILGEPSRDGLDACPDERGEFVRVGSPLDRLDGTEPYLEREAGVPVWAQCRSGCSRFLCLLSFGHAVSPSRPPCRARRRETAKRL
jgi:hypothetical protein